MLRGLSRALVRDFGRLIAARVPQDASAQPQRLGVGLEPEGTVQREQRAVPIAQSKRGVAQLVPDQCEVGIHVDRVLEGGQRFRVALELDERGTRERQREGRVSELGSRALCQTKRVFLSPLTPQ